MEFFPSVVLIHSSSS